MTPERNPYDRLTFLYCDEAYRRSNLATLLTRHHTFGLAAVPGRRSLRHDARWPNGGSRMEGWGRPDGYCLEMTAPSAVDYVRLRAKAGLTPCPTEQARLAISGSWAACHVSRRGEWGDGRDGRLIGDGGWYFHVVDMAVLPHQRRPRQLSPDRAAGTRSWCRPAWGVRLTGGRSAWPTAVRPTRPSRRTARNRSGWRDGWTGRRRQVAGHDGAVITDARRGCSWWTTSRWCVRFSRHREREGWTVDLAVDRADALRGWSGPAVPAPQRRAAHWPTERFGWPRAVKRPHRTGACRRRSRTGERLPTRGSGPSVRPLAPLGSGPSRSLRGLGLALVQHIAVTSGASARRARPAVRG